MDLIVAIAGARRMTEHEVVNLYTYTQATKIGEFMMKEKFMVITQVLKEMMSNKGRSKMPSRSRSHSRRPMRAPFKTTAKNCHVVDLDGPMEDLLPYLGKNRLNPKIANSAR